MLTLIGRMLQWKCMDNSRTYAVATMTYAEVKQFTAAKTFNALTGDGEQRELSATHMRKLEREITAGRYVPTSISASLRKTHQKHLQINEDQYTLTVTDSDPLARVDGNHRISTLDNIVLKMEDQLQKESLSHSHEWIRQQIEMINRLPFVVMIYFDGDPREDFIRLQQNKPVDRTHLVSLGIRSRSEQSPHVQLAFDLAHSSHKDQQSPLFQKVRFDSRGDGIPFSSVASKGSSDLIGSFVGLARVGAEFNFTKADKLAKFVSHAYQAILKKAPELISYGERGRVLTSPANGGARGASSMLVGLGTLLAYRVLSSGRKTPDAHDLALLVDAAQVQLDAPAFGNLSGPSKRVLLRDFAIDLLGGLEEPYHERIPERLIRTLSASSFVVSTPPKPSPSSPPTPAATAEPARQVAAKRRGNVKKSDQA